MGLAKAGSRYPEFIYHMQAIYIALGRSLEQTEQFFVQEFGMPQRNWDDIPKALITNVK